MASHRRLGFLTRNRDTFGDIVHFTLGPQDTYQLNHPEHIESILVGRHHHFVKDSITRSLKMAMGNGLVTSEGEFWRHQRKLIAPSFQARQLEGYAQLMVAETQRAMDTLRADQVLDFSPFASEITLRIVSATLLDATAESEDVLRVGRALDGIMLEFERSNFSYARFLPPWFPTSPLARTRRVVKDVDRILTEIIRHRRGRPEGDDFLSRMLSAKGEDGSGMTARQLRDEVVTLFLAGHETTAVALTYAFHLLSTHAEVASRVREEVDRVLGERPPNASDFQALKLCSAVVKEAMRLFPPVWGVGREVAAECSIGGVTFREGTQLLISQWVVHRDPRWFDSPSEFQPDRWLDGRTREIAPFAYFPFGGGPRICIGNHFAMMEAVLVLATFTQRWSVAPVDGFELELAPAVTLRPKDGLPLRLRAATSR